MDNFKTKEKLEEFLESDESEDYRDDNFHYLFLDCDNCEDHQSLHPVPYWLEEYSKNDTYFVEYIPGYWEDLEIGNAYWIIDNDMYRYIDSLSLPEEMEHQAEDGGCIYEYRGYSFLRVWKKV